MENPDKKFKITMGYYGDESGKITENKEDDSKITILGDLVDIEGINKPQHSMKVVLKKEQDSPELKEKDIVVPEKKDKTSMANALFDNVADASADEVIKHIKNSIKKLEEKIKLDKESGKSTEVAERMLKDLQGLQLVAVEEPVDIEYKGENLESKSEFENQNIIKTENEEHIVEVQTPISNRDINNEGEKVDIDKKILKVFLSKAPVETENEVLENVVSTPSNTVEELKLPDIDLSHLVPKSSTEYKKLDDLPDISKNSEKAPQNIEEDQRKVDILKKFEEKKIKVSDSVKKILDNPSFDFDSVEAPVTPVLKSLKELGLESFLFKKITTREVIKKAKDLKLKFYSRNEIFSVGLEVEISKIGKKYIMPTFDSGITTLFSISRLQYGGSSVDVAFVDEFSDDSVWIFKDNK